MRKFLLATLVFLFSLTPAFADSHVKVGRLSCEVDAGIGLILGSSKSLECTLHVSDGSEEHYSGRIDKVGLDIGFTQRTRIEWLVFAAGDQSYSAGSLSGTYLGASAEASLGLGGGANWLIGGTRDSFMLQPLSVQGQVGVNFAIGLASLTLE